MLFQIPADRRHAAGYSPGGGAAMNLAAQDALIEELYAEPEPENGGETAEGTESKKSEGADPSAESEAAE